MTTSDSDKPGSIPVTDPQPSTPPDAVDQATAQTPLQSSSTIEQPAADQPSVDEYEERHLKVGRVMQTIESRAEHICDGLSQELKSEVEGEAARIIVLLQRIDNLILNCVESIKQKSKEVYLQKLGASDNLSFPEPSKPLKVTFLPGKDASKEKEFNANRLMLRQLSSMTDSLDLAVNLLFNEDGAPNLILAKRTRLGIDRQITRFESPFWSPILNLANDVRDASTVVKVLAGTATSLLLFTAPIALGCYWTINVTQRGTSELIAKVETDRENLQSYTQAVKELERERDEAQKRLQNVQQVLLDTEQNSVNSTPRNVGRTQPNDSTPDDIEQDLDNLEKEISLGQEEIKRLSISLPEEVARLNKQRQSYGVALELALAIIAGMVGSFISILSRVIGDFQGKRYNDPMTPFYLGLFKPLIGSAFGAVLLAVVNSEIISIPASTSPAISPATVARDISAEDLVLSRASASLEDIVGDTKRIYVIFLLAFIAGFSERFAKDTIGKIEGAVNQSGANNAVASASAAPPSPPQEPASTDNDNSKPAGELIPNP